MRFCEGAPGYSMKQRGYRVRFGTCDLGCSGGCPGKLPMEDTVQVLLQRHYRGNQPSVENRTPLVPEATVADPSVLFFHVIHEGDATKNCR